VRATYLASVGHAVEPAPAPLPSGEAQIVPTRLDLATIFIPGSAKDPLTVWMKGWQFRSD
jgi:hypothetical protein